MSVKAAIESMQKVQDLIEKMESSDQKRTEIVKALRSGEMNAYEAVQTGFVPHEIIHQFVEICAGRSFYHIMQYRHIPITSDVGASMFQGFPVKSRLMKEDAKRLGNPEVDLEKARHEVLRHIEKYKYFSAVDSSVCEDYISSIAFVFSLDPYEAMNAIPMGQIREEDQEKELLARNKILADLMDAKVMDVKVAAAIQREEGQKLSKQEEIQKLMKEREEDSEW